MTKKIETNKNQLLVRLKLVDDPKSCFLSISESLPWSNYLRRTDDDHRNVCFKLSLPFSNCKPLYLGFSGVVLPKPSSSSFFNNSKEKDSIIHKKSSPTSSSFMMDDDTEYFIEINRTFFETFSLNDNNNGDDHSTVFDQKNLPSTSFHYYIEPWQKFTIAQSVHVEPFSEDDWEVLEKNSVYLEEQILNQIRFIRLHQVLPLWIHGKITLFLKITKIEQESLNINSNSANTMISLEPTENDCFKLTTDSEIIVLPKLRKIITKTVPINDRNEVTSGKLGSKNPKTQFTDGTSFYTEKQGIPVGALQKGDKEFKAFSWNPRLLTCLPIETNTPENTTILTIPFENDAISTVFINNKDFNKYFDYSTTNNKVAFAAEIESNGRKIPATIAIMENLPNNHVFLSKDIITSSFDSLTHLSRISFKFIDVSQKLNANVLAALQGVQNPPNSKTKIPVSLYNKDLTNFEWEKMLTKLIKFLRTQIEKYGTVILLLDHTEYRFTFLESKLNFVTFKPNVNDKTTNIELSPPDFIVLTTIQDLESNIEFQPLQKKSVDEKEEEAQDTRNLKVADKSRLNFNTSLLEKTFLGKEELLSQVLEQLEYHQFFFKKANAARILVQGTTKSGKTSFIKRIAEITQSQRNLLFYCIYFNCREWQHEHRISVLRQSIHDILNQAKTNAPSLILLDDLDKFIPAVNTESNDPSINSKTVQQMAEMFVHTLQDLARADQVHLIVTAKSLYSLNSNLTNAHFFDQNFNIDLPSKNQREELLRHYLKEKNVNLNHFDLTRVVSMTEGYVPVDLENIIEKAIQSALWSKVEQTVDTIMDYTTSENNDTDFKVAVNMEHIQEAIKTHIPVPLVGVSHTNPDDISNSVPWENIGGLFQVKKMLLETLKYPTKYARLFKSVPLRLRSGILLYGYPGCGKTLIASSVAQQCGCKFISVKGPELLNKYIGASEQSVRDVFQRAKAASPCILFFDEFDSIAPRRGHDSTGVTDRVVNQFLTEMDGAEGLQGVYILAATSRPDLIDSALLRPGRLDKSLFCDLPNTDELLELAYIFTKKLKLEENVSLNEVVMSLNGFSGADVSNLFSQAHMFAVHDVLEVLERDKYNQKGKGDDEDQVDGILNNFVVYFYGVLKQAHELSIEDRKEIEDNLKCSFQHNSQFENDGKHAEQEGLDGNDTHTVQVVVQKHHIQKALEECKPSLNQKEKNRFSSYFAQFQDTSGETVQGHGIGTRSTLA